MGLGLDFGLWNSHRPLSAHAHTLAIGCAIHRPPSYLRNCPLNAEGLCSPLGRLRVLVLPGLIFLRAKGFSRRFGWLTRLMSWSQPWAFHWSTPRPFVTLPVLSISASEAVCGDSLSQLGFRGRKERARRTESSSTRDAIERRRRSGPIRVPGGQIADGPWQIHRMVCRT